MTTYTKPFRELNLTHLSQVGGKNASLGEMVSQLTKEGIRVPDGFAITVEAYHAFLRENKLEEMLGRLLSTIDTATLSNLPEVAAKCRSIIAAAALPAYVVKEIAAQYHRFASDKNFPVAVRSSATVEDLPSASFAGQHDSFLNITGEKHLLEAVQRCYVSLFNDRAVKYRIDHQVVHMQVGLSVGVQQMVNAGQGCAGVIFTIDPESGFTNAIYLTGSWGLGEMVVQGAVNPDEFWIFKPALKEGKKAIIRCLKGTKRHMMICSDIAESNQSVKMIETPPAMQAAWILSDTEITQLAKWSLAIEQHYGCAMDIEWAKDGQNNQLYILQARPETVHSGKVRHKIYEYRLKQEGKVLCKGEAVGRQVISGRARIIRDIKEAGKLQPGDILVADITNPDWNALLRKAVSIITNKGGRTSHASIVARELGIAAVVGTGNATDLLTDGQLITVANIAGEKGVVLEGEVPFEKTASDIGGIPTINTAAMLILADPARAFELSMYPAGGVGLMRMEFIINDNIGIHPMALATFNQLPAGLVKQQIEAATAGYAEKSGYFIDHLSEAVATVAAAFYPRPVILRMSDFKTNEYAALMGGDLFEPREENPMLGFRGASRYYDQRYRAGFELECRAVLKVRNEMGFRNVKLMIPFCRTVEEAEKVVDTLSAFGLKRGEGELEIYMMMEIPSNIVLAEKFAAVFDGFSIGSNDLTQLTLGIDRDSAIVSHLFDENNEAVLTLIRQAIRAAKKAGIPIGLCGQAASDFPAFARFLVNEGIGSISFTPDALLKGIENIAEAEQKNTLVTT